MDELEGTGKVPLSFWVVAGLGVLWNGFAFVGYWLTATHNPKAMAQTPAEMVEALNHTPDWAMAAWGLAVALPLVALLLVRDRAVPPPVFERIDTAESVKEASHAPPHPVSQHVPSTQLPDVHWLPPPHVPPFAFFGAQAPLAQ